MKVAATASLVVPPIFRKTRADGDEADPLSSPVSTLIPEPVLVPVAICNFSLGLVVPVSYTHLTLPTKA